MDATDRDVEMADAWTSAWRKGECGAAAASPLSVADVAMEMADVADQQLRAAPALLWFPGLLAACFSYLDLVSVLKCEVVAKEWRAVAQDAALWEQLYCSTWRRGAALPAAAARRVDMKHVFRQRSRVSLSLSTKAVWWVHRNESLRVHNVGMQRIFSRGCVESARTDEPLEPLAILSVPVCDAAARPAAGVCYFEVRVRGCGSVGLVSLSRSNERKYYGAGSASHVGWRPVSYGYHGDDGSVYWHDGTAPIGGLTTPFGPKWGDTRAIQRPTGADLKVTTIGCGYDLHTGVLFFTKDGEFVGTTSMRVERSREFGAAVTLHYLGDTAELNLGRAPFVFDIEAHVATRTEAAEAA